MWAPVSRPCGSKSARGTDDGVDSLSSLPDELLHHVMSFLPMPEVVRTSLLSTRWRYLWASTPFIRIDQNDFMDGDKLEKFGDGLLLLRDSAISLDEARIIIYEDYSTRCSVWIRRAIMHKVRLLHVSGFRGCDYLDTTTMSPSQHLKTIRLHSFMLTDEFFAPLNHDCPVLEHLELERCGFSDLKDISSRSLKVLRIIRCYIGKDLVISATNLTHLSIIDPLCDSGAMLTRNMSSMVTAVISLRSEYFHYDNDSIQLDHRLLDGLSHATTLELHAPLPEFAFERGLRTCPVFSNLTSLVLGDWCMAANFYPLRRILHRSPKLKELSFKLEMEECKDCKRIDSALPSSRGAPSSGSVSYPCIGRIKIDCRKEDPRVGALVQTLLPIAGDAKISIECR